LPPSSPRRKPTAICLQDLHDTRRRADRTASKSWISATTVSHNTAGTQAATLRSDSDCPRCRRWSRGRRGFKQTVVAASIPRMKRASVSILPGIAATLLIAFDSARACTCLAPASPAGFRESFSCLHFEGHQNLSIALGCRRHYADGQSPRQVRSHEAMEGAPSKKHCGRHATHRRSVWVSVRREEGVFGVRGFWPGQYRDRYLHGDKEHCRR
jgi:hypothetical protein